MSQNKKVILLGGGNSISLGLQKNLWEKIKGNEIWSLNYGFLAMPYLPNKQVWVDIRFFEKNIDKLQKLSEQGVSLTARKHLKYAGLTERIELYEGTREQCNYYGREACSKGVIYYGRMGFCGMFALSLAVGCGYNNIFLLGYDFGTTSPIDKKTHFYQGLVKTMSTGVGRPEVYRNDKNKVKIEVNDFNIYTRETDVRITNVSLNSNIPFFRKIDYDTFFEELYAD